MAQRKLSDEEIKAIKGYKLSPAIEQEVWDAWSRNEEIKAPGLFVSFVGYSFVFGSTATLWMRYFFPSMGYSQGLINLVLFLLWFVFLIVVIARISQSVSISKEEECAFKKWALDCWYQRKGLGRLLIITNSFGLLIGLVFNGYFATAAMALLCYIIMVVTGAGIRAAVQGKMDKIVPPQKGDVINAEFSII